MNKKGSKYFDNFFVVVDRGFTFLPPNMKTDHLVTLERFCEEEGALVLAPRGKDPDWILQLNGTQQNAPQLI